MNNPLVSIIIPVYNSESYLADTINSALNQTWQNIEIILVDDGSSDSSLKIAKSFESKTIKVFSQANKGASAARNKGILESNGDYVQFLDADDLLSENKIECQVKLLENNNDYIALGGTLYFFDGEIPATSILKHEWFETGSDDPADFLIKLYGGSYIGPTYGGMASVHSWLTPKSIIDKAGKWNEDLSTDDDGEYFCRVVLASKGIVYSKEGFSLYRKYVNKLSLSNAKNHKSHKSLLNAIDLKAKHLLGSTNSPLAKLALCRVYWELAVSFFPEYLDLYIQAEKNANILDPNFRNTPYNKGISSFAAKVFGWKFVRFIKFYKARF